jgi:hypothetical protein
MWPQDTPRPDDLKHIIVQIHLNHLHSIQLDMIDEAVVMSDWHEAKEVLQYIMEKK